MELELNNIIRFVHKAINKRSGENVIVLDIKKVSPICDYFIIASGTSTRQVKLIADEIQSELLKQGIDLLRREGYDSGKWVLLDYGDVVVHVFHEVERKFYNIEGIWKDAGNVHIDANQN